MNNVVYWFKNARAAHKRAEQKCCSESNGLQSPCHEAGSDMRTLVLEQGSSRPTTEGETERYSGGDSHSESQANSSDDSDNVHTLDLSVRRCHNGNLDAEHGEEQNPELRIKEEPRDSSSDHSMESSDSGDEEVDVMDDSTVANDEQDNRPEFSGDSILTQQNGNLSGHDMIASQVTDVDQQLAYSNRGLGHLEERRKRNRTFIDPVTEVPKLEQWFSANTHPAHSQIVRFTQDLNSMQYRQKFPKLEPKNIQFWFKNRRAKCKRLNLAALQTPVSCSEKMILPAN